MTHLTNAAFDPTAERRSGEDRRIAGLANDRATTATLDPIAAWNLVLPTHLGRVHATDPWTQAVHRSLVHERDGDHDDAARAWDESAVWQLMGHDPTGN